MIGLARIYSPTLGRFLQTDPIGYGDGLNWYNYVGSDPVNATDPSGLKNCKPGDSSDDDDPCEVTVRARLHADNSVIGGGGGFGGFIFPGGHGDGMGVLQGGGGGSFGAMIFFGLVDMAQRAVRQVADVVCSTPSLEGGFGADLYAGVGGSVGGSLKIDIASGQIGAAFSNAVGVGFGADAGPSVTLSPSGSRVISANVTVGAGAGVGGGVVVNHNVIGTDRGQTSYSFGRFGTPVGFMNGGVAAGFNTPKINPLGCKGK